MTKDEVDKLIDKYLAGSCTPEEMALIEKAYTATYGENAGEIDKAALEQQRKRVYTSLRRNSTKKIRTLQNYIRIAAAAILLLTLASALYFTISHNRSGYSQSSDKSKGGRTAQSDILPGYNQATLTLADGKKVLLDSAQSGIIVINEDIKYQSGGSVTGVFLSEGRVKSPRGLPNSLLSLTTPKGGQYQVTLSDGTKVWLNAASTLKYPSRFSGNSREVEISGEAFFDVAQVKDKPFKVKSRRQVVDVLGTSFNISAYAEDPSVKTTLITGVVQVSAYDENKPKNQSIIKRLIPGQQVINHNGEIEVKAIDINTAIAWKSGDFYFKNTTLEDMMQQLIRWYDIEVTYKSPIPKETFTGDMPRNASLRTVLELLKISGIRFHLEGRRLYID
ncbi:FecR family protein [bacterium A37T11]|nr:FecR family protein [bacterium A37T11]